MSRQPRPYPPSKLPPGFAYPPAFLEFLGSNEFDALYPWWLIDGESRAGELGLLVASQLNKPWVPFAKTDDLDDVACFIAGDPVGEFKIAMLTSTPERNYGFRSFEEWLLEARRDAARWRGDDV